MWNILRLLTGRGIVNFRVFELLSEKRLGDDCSVTPLCISLYSFLISFHDDSIKFHELLNTSLI